MASTAQKYTKIRKERKKTLKKSHTRPSIGQYAFSACSGLRHVYCHAVNPPSGGYTPFYDTPISSATLHVPAESLDAYKAARPWSRFGTIVAL